MPFVIVRTRASGAIVTVDAPQVLLKHLKTVCVTKGDAELNYKPFKFQWIQPSEAYRGGLEGKLEMTYMTVRKILNTIEACGWVLVATHSYAETGSEYVMSENKSLPPSAVMGLGFPITPAAVTVTNPPSVNVSVEGQQHQSTQEESNAAEAERET